MTKDKALKLAQEPVSFPCCGYTDAIKWNQGVVQCHMCGQVYTAAQPAQEPEREALKLALEALENMCDAQSNPDRRNFPTIHDYGKAQRACIAIKAALAQPAQDVDYWIREATAARQAEMALRRELEAQPAQEQRKWVGLTDQESIDIIKKDNNYKYPIQLLQAVMDALKAKNT
jgi:uncharacterized membrane protein